MENGFKPCSASAEHGGIYIIVKVMDFTLNTKQIERVPEITQQNFLQVCYASLYILNSIFIRPPPPWKGWKNGHLIYDVVEAPGNSSVDELVSWDSDSNMNLVSMALGSQRRSWNQREGSES